LLTGTRTRWRSDNLVLGLSILALVAQGSVFLIWPSLSDSLEVQLLAIPLLLVSFRWWENFANTHEAIGEWLLIDYRTHLDSRKVSLSTGFEQFPRNRLEFPSTWRY